MTTIYEARDHLLICTGYGDPGEHQHMAAHLILSVEGPMEVEADSQGISCRGILIPSGVRHKIQTGGATALVFLFDSTSGVSEQISQVKQIPEETCRQILLWFHAFEKQNPPEGYDVFFARTLALLGLGKRAVSVTDERIRQALFFIRAHARERITCREIAETVFLSTSRFSHLFKEQVGMTVPAYLIYQRLMYGYAEVIRGKSITESAIDAGFSSSAHFADISRRVFGLSASRITQDLRLVRVQ